MGKCVGAPHPDTFPYTSPHPFPTRQHTSSPHTLSYPLPTHPIHSTTLLHSPHVFPYLPPHPKTFPYTSPHTSSHSSPDLPLHSNTLPHSSHALSPHLPPQFRSRGEVTMRRRHHNKFNWKSPIKFFTTTGNLKSCFGVGNVNFRCMKVWQSYHVAKLLATQYKVLYKPWPWCGEFIKIND